MDPNVQAPPLTGQSSRDFLIIYNWVLLWVWLCRTFRRIYRLALALLSLADYEIINNITLA